MSAPPCAVGALDAALTSVARGFYVFPIGAGGEDGALKTPLVKWRDLSSNDPDTVRSLFAACPGATGHGIDCGKSGVVALDVDGDVGNDNAQILFELHGPPSTFVVSTSSGAHLYFLAPKGVGIKNWTGIGKHDPSLRRGVTKPDKPETTGLDTRAAGGYLVGPGSMHASGQVYAVAVDARIAPCPDWLIELATGRGAPGPDMGGALAGARAATVADMEKAEKALRSMAKRITAAPKGSGNATLNTEVFKIAAKWAHVLGDAPVVQGALKAMTDRELKLYPDEIGRLNENEARATIESGLRAGRDANDEQRKGWRGKLSRGENGQAHSSQANVTTVFSCHEDLGGVLRYDERNERPVLACRPPWATAGGELYPRAVRDEDATHAVTWLRDAVDLPAASVTAAFAGMCAAARLDSFDPFRDYLDGLEWDGRGRLDACLIDHAGAEDCVLTRAFFSKWMISAVARTYLPGCQADSTLILEGPQGLKKSSLFLTLASEPFFVDNLGSLESKDAAAYIHGPVIVEFSELGDIGRGEVETVKAFLTRRVDKVRPAYGRTVREQPRRCVFGATINPEGGGYLRDTSGNRRFWPVAVSHVDLPAVLADRDQLWAEAVARFERGEQWWLEAELEQAASEAQAERQTVDPWCELLEQKLEKGPGVMFGASWEPGQVVDGRLQWVSLDQALDMVESRKSTPDAKRLHAVLAALGWEMQRTRVDGKRARRFYRPT